MSALLPYEHAEMNVLGAVLRVPKVLEQLQTEIGLRAGHFHDLRRQAIFEAMVELADRGRTVDSVTVAAHLTVGAKNPQAVKAAIDEIAGPVPNLAGWRDHAQLVLTEAQWRDRERAAHQQLEAISQRDEGAYTAAAAAADGTGDRVGASRTPEQLAGEFMDWFESDQTVAIPLPFPRLTDMMAGGLRPGDTSIVAGWSSMGKSVFADQVLEHATLHGHSAWLYVNEMSHVDRVCRLLAARSGVPFRNIIRKDLTADQARQVTLELPRLPFGITVCAGWSAREIARDVRRRRVDIACVDLVTRIPAHTTADWDEVSGTLADAGRQSGTHLILVCQLNRERAKDALRPAPALRDLRNTGAWEQDHRNVLFVHRPEELNDSTGTAEPSHDGFVQIAKASNSEKGSCPIRLNPRRMRFEPITARLEAAA